MTGKSIDFFQAMFILIIAIIVIGALVEDAFGIPDAAKVIFFGIGGIAAIIALFKAGIHKIF